MFVFVREARHVRDLTGKTTTALDCKGPFMSDTIQTKNGHRAYAIRLPGTARRVITTPPTYVSVERVKPSKQRQQRWRRNHVQAKL